jgi:Tol biopolymer transport system component
VFVHDRRTRTTQRVSVTSNDRQGNRSSNVPTLSANGRFVPFTSYASNLVKGDTNGEGDAFVHDLATGTTERVSVASDGKQGQGISWIGGISAFGRFVLFSSFASNLVKGDTNRAADVFVRDRRTGTTTWLSVTGKGIQGNGTSFGDWISGDGRFVVFESEAFNLVKGDTNDSRDVFVLDRKAGTIERVSVASDGRQGNAASFGAHDRAITPDGRYVVFLSSASNLVPGDSNGVHDVFVRDRTKGVTTRESLSSAGGQTNDYSYEPTLSDTGAFVAFSSEATNLVPGDKNGARDIFVRDRGR